MAPAALPDAPVVPDRIPADLGQPKRADDGKPYQVILWNDPVNTMDHVITALIRVVPAMDLNSAYGAMMTAHTRGSAIVAEAPKEQAELYQEGLQRHGLTVTLEPA